MVLLIIKAFLLGWFIANFEPFQESIKPLKAKFSDKHYAVFYLKTAVSCHKCLSFWIGFAISLNIYVAAGAGLIAFIFDKHLTK